MSTTTGQPGLDIKHTIVGPDELDTVSAVLSSADLSGNAAAVTALPVLAVGAVPVFADQRRGRIARRRQTLGTLNQIVADTPDLVPLPVPGRGEPNAYAALFTSNHADEIAHRLAKAGITSDPLRYGYRPVYHTPALAGHRPKRLCENAERLTRTLVTLPCHEAVGPAELERIAIALTR